MLNHINPEELLYLDIETVPSASSYELMEESLRKIWDKKASLLKTEDESPESLFPRSAIYAEFGKIICISVGLVHREGAEMKIRLKSFYGEDEAELLKAFARMLESSTRKRSFSLCAHNGKEFDFPYISRRMLINGIELPPVLDNAGKKPWEIQLVDTMELWKFGEFRSYASLELLTTVFGIPSPKDDIDGSMVGKIYYEEKDLKRIVNYCEKDVIAIIQLILRFKGMDLIPDSSIEIIE